MKEAPVINGRFFHALKNQYLPKSVLVSVIEGFLAGEAGSIGLDETFAGEVD